MKDIMRLLNHLYIINDKGETVIIDEIKNDTLSQIANNSGSHFYRSYYYFNNERKASELFFKELNGSKHVLFPIIHKDTREEKGFVKIDSDLTFKDYYNFLRDISFDSFDRSIYDNLSAEITLGKAKFREEKDTLSVYKALKALIHNKAKVDREFRLGIIEEFISNKIETSEESNLNNLMNILDIELSYQNDSVESKGKDNIFYIVGMKVPNESELSLDVQMLKRIFNFLNSLSNNPKYKRTIQDMNNIKSLKEYLFLRETEWTRTINIDSGYYFTPSSISNMYLIKSLSDEQMLNISGILEKIYGGTFIHFYIEFFRRNLHRGRKFDYKFLIPQIMSIGSSMEAIPITYKKEIGDIIGSIILNSDNKNFINYFFIEALNFSNTHKIELDEVVDVLFKENFEEMKSKGIVSSGMSYDYFKLLFRITRDKKKISKNLFEKDFKYLFQDELESYSRKFAAILFYFEEDIKDERLAREVLKEGFLAIHRSQKAEKARFIRIISLIIHHNKFNKSEDGSSMFISENHIVMFLDEMMKSNLKNMIVERIIDKPNYKGFSDDYYAEKRTNNNLLFGLDYAEATNVIKKVNYRGNLDSVLVKLMLQ
jgi:hypothetical protein